MKLNRLLLASGIAVALVTICLINAVSADGYYTKTYGKSAINWRIWANAYCWYNTETYVVTIPPSFASHIADGGVGVGCTVDSWQHYEYSTNICAQVQATYTVWGGGWTSAAQAWVYPSYTGQPTGGYYNEW